METTMQNSKPSLTKQFKQWMDGAATKAMTVMAKQMVEKHQKTSRRELVDASSTFL